MTGLCVDLKCTVLVEAIPNASKININIYDLINNNAKELHKLDTSV
jgi:hypothetical protein